MATTMTYLSSTTTTCTCSSVPCGSHDLIFLFSLSDDKGCSYCGGLGHRITECPKLEAMQQKQAGSIGKRDYLASSAQDW